MVEVTVAPDGEITLDRLFCAVDVGIVINPDAVIAQMEGGIIFGLTAALGNEITIENGSVEQSNFHDFPMLRIADSPEIIVDIVLSELPPGGAGEPGIVPVSAALAMPSMRQPAVGCARCRLPSPRRPASARPAGSCPQPRESAMLNSHQTTLGPDAEPLLWLLDEMDQGRKGALLTVTAVYGGAPRPVGTHMAVVSGKRFSVYVSGGGCVETAIATEFEPIIARGQDAVIRFGKGSPLFDIRFPCGSGIDVLAHVGIDAALLENTLDRVAERQAFAIAFSPNLHRVCVEDDAASAPRSKP